MMLLLLLLSLLPVAGLIFVGGYVAGAQYATRNSAVPLHRAPGFGGWLFRHLVAGLTQAQQRELLDKMNKRTKEERKS